MKRIVPVVLVSTALVTVWGCATLRGLFEIQQPRARIQQVSISRLTFQEAELVARIAIENPNPIGISLAGLGYSLDLGGNRFIEGDQPRRLEIPSIGEGTVELPFTIGYRELLQTLVLASTADAVDYLMQVELRFDLPGVGMVRLPLRHEGILPVLRMPAVRVGSLSLRSISITAAELELSIEVENPNGFALGLARLGYAFTVLEQVWVEGATARPATVPARGIQIVKIPFRLSFAAFGRTVRDLLLADREITYRFEASARIEPDMAHVVPFDLPVSFDGSIPLRR